MVGIISYSATDLELKELRHGQRILKKLASFFKFVDCDRFYPSSVETILGYFRVGVFLCYFKVSFNFKVMTKTP